MLPSPTIDKFKARLTSPAATNVLWLSFDKLLKLIIGLVVGIWVARYLGPQQWGEINYVAAIIAIMISIANLGMDGFLVKEILEHPQNKHTILGTAFLMRAISSVLSCLLAAGYFFFSQSNPIFLFIFLLLSLNIISVPLDLIDIEFQSKLQSRQTVTSKNLAYVIGAVLKILCISNGKSIFWFAGVMGLETALAYIFLVFNYQKRNNILKWKFSSQFAKRFIKFGWPFIVSNLAIILYMRIDQVMLQSLAGSYQQGLFGAAAKITEIFTFIPMALASSAMPSLVKAYKQSEQEFRKNIQYFINWMLKISLAIAIILSLSSTLVVNLLYGEKFSHTDSILVIHVWALIPMFVGVASSYYLVIKNLQKYNSYKTLIGLIINVALNYLLIPKYGAIGASLATLFSHYTSVIFINLLFTPTRELFFFQVRSFLFLYKFSK